jgi:polyisoprenoid-binding protein YceI
MLAAASLEILGGTLISSKAFSGDASGYIADPHQSKLEFYGVQAGAEFKGEFHQFTGSVQLSPDALASAVIDVQISMNSLDSQDKDRDQTMRSTDIFDVAHFSTAHYVTRSIAKTVAGYTAQGSLTLRGVTKDVPIEFRFSPAAGGAKLEGTAKLNRLDFGVGQGDWKSTEWVANAVKISFSLGLKPKS